jgi:preprotein translocase subunit SecG
MYLFVSILILVICVLLGLIVLVQNPKGGGLAANFAGSGSQFMGVRQTADFLEKATWSLAVGLLVLSLVGSMIVPRPTEEVIQSQLQERVNTEDQAMPIDFAEPPPRTVASDSGQ